MITTQDRVMQAYLCIHDVLDQKAKSSKQRAEWLSEASSHLAIAYKELSGKTIGEAQGWDKVAGHA